MKMQILLSTFLTMNALISWGADEKVQKESPDYFALGKSSEECAAKIFLYKPNQEKDSEHLLTTLRFLFAKPHREGFLELKDSSKLFSLKRIDEFDEYETHNFEMSFAEKLSLFQDKTFSTWAGPELVAQLTKYLEIQKQKRSDAAHEVKIIDLLKRKFHIQVKKIGYDCI